MFTDGAGEIRRINLKRIFKKCQIPRSGIVGSTEGYICLMEVENVESISVMTEYFIKAQLNFANWHEVCSGEGMNRALEAESGDGDYI